MQEINSSEDLRNFIEFTTGMEESEQQIDEQQIESRWDMYITEIEGSKALVLVDMALSGIAPLMEYNILFGLQIGILNPSEDGFYTAEEQPKLYEIEDRAVDIFTKEARAASWRRLLPVAAELCIFMRKTIISWRR